MALQLPTPEDLTAYEDGLSDEQAIQQAADLFTLATGISDTPTDEFQKRLINDAILEMAWALKARHDDFESSVSPFSGERIGSYSYQKTNQAIAAGNSTGVPWFDKAVAYFEGQNADSDKLAAADSEYVFVPGQPWAGITPGHLSHDPSYIFP